MAKSSKKKSGPPYKLPKERYLVVTSPWTRNKEGITAWFAVMLKERYFDKRVTAIYSQKDSDDNMIIQLPREVEDISYFLGAHFHSAFLMDRPRDNKVSYVYQYDWANHNDPAIKFHEYFPNHGPIPHPQFPFIKDPYPPPMIAMAPPPFVPYACKISSNMKELVFARIAAAPLPAQTVAPQPSTSRTTLDDSSQADPGLSPLIFRQASDLEDKKPLSSVTATTDPRLAHRTKLSQQEIPEPPDATSVKKIDPYEEARFAEQLLQAPLPVKDETEEFLSSFLPSVKEEEMKSSIVLKDEDTIESHAPGGSTSDGGYEPSAELLAAFGMLSEHSAGSPQPQMKPEPVADELPEYQPSEDLLASFTEFSAQMGSDRAPARSDQIRVKPEPVESFDYLLSPIEHQTSMKTLERNSIIKQLHSRIPSVQIKSEPREPDIGTQSSRAYRQGVQVSPTRDPRGHQYATPTVRGKREGDNTDRLKTGLTPTKRIKTEPQD